MSRTLSFSEAELNRSTASEDLFFSLRCGPLLRVHYFVRGGFVGHRSRASSKHLSPHLPVGSLDSSEGQTGVALHLQCTCGCRSTKKPTRCCFREVTLQRVFIDGIMDKMQDKDPKHMAKSVKLYLLYHCKKELQTPPQSPDLNVIENLWSQLDKSVHEHAITSKENLKNVLKEGTKITVEATKKLVESMPKRLQAVIKAKGFATKY
ncbi:transposable element Tcb2 transposase [Trichonephila clavipes]|nr:transposable element Tcb2 transposase [Trichonephila clavipes]